MTRGPCPGRSAGGRSGTAGSTGEDPRRAAAARRVALLLRDQDERAVIGGRGHASEVDVRLGRDDLRQHRAGGRGPDLGGRGVPVVLVGVGGRRQGDVVRRDGGPADRLARRPPGPAVDHGQGGGDHREDQGRGGQRGGPADPAALAWPDRAASRGVARGGQPQRRRVGGDLAGRIPQRGAQLVFQPGHDGSPRAWPSALRARAVADLTELGRRPIRRAISRSGRSR